MTYLLGFCRKSQGKHTSPFDTDDVSIFSPSSPLFYYMFLLHPSFISSPLSSFAVVCVRIGARTLVFSPDFIYIYSRHIYAIFPPEVGVGGIRTEITAPPVRIRPRPVVYDGHLRTAFRGRANPVFIYFFREIRPFVLCAVGPPGEETGSERRISRPFCKQHTSRVLSKFPTSWPKHRPSAGRRKKS